MLILSLLRTKIDWKRIDWKKMNWKLKAECAEPLLLQAEVHLAVFIEVDPQHVFLPAGKLARHRGGPVIGGFIGGHLHPKTMFTG